jgi:hypothetical protein
MIGYRYISLVLARGESVTRVEILWSGLVLRS